MIRVRASDDELAKLVTNAQKIGLTLSAYLRWRGLSFTRPVEARPVRRPASARKKKRSS
jgi:hypothetical protein